MPIFPRPGGPGGRGRAPEEGVGVETRDAYAYLTRGPGADVARALVDQAVREALAGEVAEYGPGEATPSRAMLVRLFQLLDDTWPVSPQRLGDPPPAPEPTLDGWLARGARRRADYWSLADLLLKHYEITFVADEAADPGE